MIQLNRHPVGILDFLGIKNGGMYPQELGTVLAPTWDLRRFYLDNGATHVRTTGNLTNADRGTTLSIGFAVPVGEMWYVDRVSFTTALFAAGQSCQISFNLQKSGLAVQELVLPGQYYQGPIAAGGLETYSVGVDVDRLLYAGDQIGLKADKVVDGGTSIAFSCVIRYTPLITRL